MPELIKNHACHDILLLCIPCFTLYEPVQKRFKEKLADQYDAPLEGKPFNRYPERRQVVNAASALTARFANKIPHDRKEELRHVVREYFKVDQVTEELLQQARDMPLIEKAEGYREHGEIVVQAMTYDQVVAFVRKWRWYFLEALSPQHLSPNWKIDNPVARII